MNFDLLRKNNNNNNYNYNYYTIIKNIYIACLACYATLVRLLDTPMSAGTDGGIDHYHTVNYS